jgi:hypothetical protein
MITTIRALILAGLICAIVVDLWIVLRAFLAWRKYRR